MANHLHLLLRPDHASELPKLMHWFGWYSAMALNRLSGRCGHFWEARSYATAIAAKDHRRVLNTLRYIHANPKAAGIRKGFYDPYSNYGHDGRLACDGISEWHPSFLKLASSLKGVFQAISAVLPNVSPSRQSRSQMPLGLTDAEAIGSEQQQQQKQEQACLARATATPICI
jgi:REP element-mobilizing transposase RayT